MLTRLSLLMSMRVWAALLLAAIGLQAAEPMHAPLEQRHGSAFSASTYEVAVGMWRGDESAAAVNLVPVPLVPVAALVPLVRDLSHAVAGIPPRPASTAPPLPFAAAAWPPAPRAPPLA